MGRQRGNGEVAAVDAGEALRESKARYRAVVQPSADGIGLMDAATLHLLEANPAFFELLGYTEEELPELTVYDIVAHDRAEVERARLETRFLQMDKMEAIG